MESLTFFMIWICVFFATKVIIGDAIIDKIYLNIIILKVHLFLINIEILDLDNHHWINNSSVFGYTKYAFHFFRIDIWSNKVFLHPHLNPFTYILTTHNFILSTVKPRARFPGKSWQELSSLPVHLSARPFVNIG